MTKKPYRTFLQTTMNYEIATIYYELNKKYQYENAQEFFEDIQEDYPKLKTSKLVRFGKNQHKLYRLFNFLQGYHQNDQYICEILIPEDVANELYNYTEKYYDGGYDKYGFDERIFPGVFNERESNVIKRSIAKEWDMVTIIP